MRFLGGEGPAAKFVACGVVARLLKSVNWANESGCMPKTFGSSDQHGKC